MTEFWWRDDDAGTYHPALEQLLELGARNSIPIALAVVPHWLVPETVKVISGSKASIVLQHGWSHADHAYPGQKKIELGGSATPDASCPLLELGWNKLERAFGEKFVSILVPPWNRIDRAHDKLANDLGYLAVSTFCSDSTYRREPITQRIDAHIDAIDWANDRRPKPLEDLLATADELIVSKASNVGFLTHHKDHVASDFAVLEQFAEYIAGHSRAKWSSVREFLQRPTR